MEKKLIIAIICLVTFLFNLNLKANIEGRNIIRKTQAGVFLAEKNLFDARFIMRFKEDINLSKEQEKKVENLLLAFEENSIKKSAEIKIRELRFASYLKSEKINRKKIERQLKAISKMKTDFLIDYINYLLDLKQIMTHAQIEKLKEIKKGIIMEFIKLKKKNELIH
jgi:Spy/CpxP family protein refolding chaperone